MLNEELLQDESKNIKMKCEIISLIEEMNKQRKVECSTILLKNNILEQQEQLHDVKLECFIEIQKLTDKMKILEKYLEIVS